MCETVLKYPEKTQVARGLQGHRWVLHELCSDITATISTQQKPLLAQLSPCCQGWHQCPCSASSSFKGTLWAAAGVGNMLRQVFSPNHWGSHKVQIWNELPKVITIHHPNRHGIDRIPIDYNPSSQWAWHGWDSNLLQSLISVGMAWTGFQLITIHYFNGHGQYSQSGYN